MIQVSMFEEETEDVTNTLECNTCGEHKPIDKFQVMASGEIKRKCRDCQAHEKKIRDELRALNEYPPEDYACPICERQLDDISSRGQQKLQKWVLDHCHKTDSFRGWLCFHCNTGLGAFKDNPEHLERAIKYLSVHK